MFGLQPPRHISTLLVMMGSNQMRAASIVPSFNGRPRCEPLSYGPIGRRWLTMQSTTNLFDEDRTDVTVKLGEA